MYLVQLDIRNRILSEMKILQCIQNDVVAKFNDVLRTAHLALNIESIQSVTVLTFEWALSVTKNNMECKFILWF